MSQQEGSSMVFACKRTRFFFLKGYEYQRINSIKKLKLLGEISRYDLYHYTTHPSSESSLNLKLAQTHITLCLIFIK